MLLFALSSLFACSTYLVRTAPSALDEKAKKFSSIQGKAILYTYRGGSIFGSDYTTVISINGKKVATGARNRFNVIVLEPGNYKLGIDSSVNYGETKYLDIEIAQSKLYFFEETWKVFNGFSPTAMKKIDAIPVISDLKLISWKEI